MEVEPGVDVEGEEGGQRHRGARGREGGGAGEGGGVVAR